MYGDDKNVQTSTVKQLPIGCPETSLKDHHPTLREISQEHRSQTARSTATFGKPAARHSDITYHSRMADPCGVFLTNTIIASVNGDDVLSCMFISFFFLMFCRPCVSV